MASAGDLVVGTSLSTSLDRARRWPLWLGPCASLLCLVHCLSLPLLLLLAPGLFRHIPYNSLHEMELIFWMIAVEAGTRTLKDAGLSGRVTGGFFALAVVGLPLSWLNHRYYYGVLGLMMTYQFFWIVSLHLTRRRRTPPCCTHSH